MFWSHATKFLKQAAQKRNQNSARQLNLIPFFELNNDS
jgi:hypothetical protein